MFNLFDFSVHFPCAAPGTPYSLAFCAGGLFGSFGQMISTEESSKSCRKFILTSSKRGRTRQLGNLELVSATVLSGAEERGVQPSSLGRSYFSQI